MDVYLFKLMFGTFIMPFSLLLTIAISGLLLVLLNKKPRLAKTLLSVSLLGLYLISTSLVANGILAPLEFKYPAYKPKQQSLAYIVVLGCGHSQSGYLPQSSLLGGCSHIRLQEALRLYQLHPGAKVIFTGNSGHSIKTLAENMADIAIKNGILASDIIIEKRPFDTIEEVKYVSQQIVDAPSALVTSAAHMTRSMMLFDQQGIADIIPAPTDYLIRSTPSEFHPFQLMPHVNNIRKVHAAAHEYYGLLWLNIKSLWSAE